MNIIMPLPIQAVLKEGTLSPLMLCMNISICKSLCKDCRMCVCVCGVVWVGGGAIGICVCEVCWARVGGCGCLCVCGCVSLCTRGHTCVCVCVSAIVLLNSSHTSGSVSGGSGRELKEVVQ